MDRNKIEKDFCRRFNRDPKSIPVVALSYLETISISRSFRPDLTTQSNRSMLSASPLFPAKIYPQIYISSRLLFARFFLATRQRNNTLDSKRFRRYVYARKVIMVCSFFLFREKKKKEERKKIEFLRVEETLEKKESRNLSSKALKSHLPMVASDVKQSPSLSLSLFSVLFSFSNQSSLSPPPATCWRKDDLQRLTCSSKKCHVFPSIILRMMEFVGNILLASPRVKLRFRIIPYRVFPPPMIIPGISRLE